MSVQVYLAGRWSRREELVAISARLEALGIGLMFSALERGEVLL